MAVAGNKVQYSERLNVQKSTHVMRTSLSHTLSKLRWNYSGTGLVLQAV